MSDRTLTARFRGPDLQASVSVYRLPEERHLLQAGDGAGFLDALLGIFAIVAAELREDQQDAFARWAALPMPWSAAHNELFAFAMSTWIATGELDDPKFLPAVEALRRARLPAMPRPFTIEMHALFRSVFKR
jgi:hypothetical protein